MATADGSAFVLVRHPAVPHGEVARVLAARWPHALVGDTDLAEPSWDFAVEDAAALARVRRGVEPLRIVVPKQRAAAAAGLHADEAPGAIEPMPILF